MGNIVVSISETMGRDKRGVNRGTCTCGCPEYEVVEPTHILCDYCGHPPMHHAELKYPLSNSSNDDINTDEQQYDRDVTTKNLDICTNHIFTTADPDKKIKELEASRSDGSESEHECPDDDKCILPAPHCDEPQGNKPIQDKHFDKMQSELERLTSDATLVKEGENMHVFCNLCKVKLTMGSSNRWGTVKKHLSRASHQIILSSREMESSSLKTFEELDKLHPHVFLQKKEEARCVDCGDQGALTLSSKNLKYNAASHVQSASHKLKAQKRGASTSQRITSFFTAVPNKSKTSEPGPKQV
jgi:hypothetical protein